MQRVNKFQNSKIVSDGIRYVSEGNNTKLASILLIEQKGFCAYTETYLGRSDKKEIDHFNPSYNFLERNEYNNLFLVKAKWNSEKSNKWSEYQPVLHPTDVDFDQRIVYDNGDYRVSDSNDFEALNLIRLLKLDDADLADERKRYINRKRGEIEVYGVNVSDFFKELIEIDINSIQFLRAIKEEFGVDVKLYL
jgi:hypothetical protein